MKMNRKIRSGCFETNSSSEHAICLNSRRFHKDEIEPQTIFFNHQHFPRRTEVYDSLQDKANYLYQAIWDVLSNKYCRDKYEFNYHYSDAIRRIHEVLKKYNVECEFPEVHEDESGHPCGGIDHGIELGGWIDICLSSENYLLAYLFWKSKVVVGSDEGAGGDFEETLMDVMEVDELWYKYTG